MSVIEIKEPVINSLTVKVLEDALLRAKKGDIYNIVIFGTDGDGNTFNQFNVGNDNMNVLAECRLVERDLIDIHCQIRKEVSWEFCE